MKKRLIPLLAACLLLTGCSSLPTAREMGDMALMRTMGIDTVPDGVRVTGSTGPRARGLEAEGEPSLVLTAERPSLSGACLAMQGQSDSFVFFGYVDQLLIGEELASEGVSPVLDYFAQDVELGLGAQLWLVRGTTAQEAVSSGGDEGIDQRLETLQHDGKMGIASISRTAGETYVDLMELGSAFVPALSPAGNETGVLLESGYGIIKDGALAGFLDGEAAKGLELLAGGGAADILDIELADNKVSAKITSAHTQSAFEFQEDTLSALKLTCEVEVRVTEYQRRLSDEAGAPGAGTAGAGAGAAARLARGLRRPGGWGRHGPPGQVADASGGLARLVRQGASGNKGAGDNTGIKAGGLWKRIKFPERS